MENNPEYLLKVLREKKLKRVTGTDSETTVDIYQGNLRKKKSLLTPFYVENSPWWYKKCKWKKEEKN